MKYKAILLFGAPGSGKGTQGKILSAIPGFFHSSTGDIFRSLDLQSEWGRQVWDFTRRGELVPDELALQIWKHWITGMEMVNGFRPSSEILVLDGLPRSKRQAELLDGYVEVLKVIYLDCKDMSKMVERLRRRALRENRPDDANDKVIKNRLEVYERDTMPVLSHYSADKIIKLDATAARYRSAS